MRSISFGQATVEATAAAMREDETVVVAGEDIGWGGNFGQFNGLLKEFGPKRVLDMPISEALILGSAVGAAVTGLRPVASLSFVEFTMGAMDEIINQAAKFRYMFGGNAETPVVIRTMYGAGLRAAAQHSQCLYPVFTHIPGLKVVTPATPYDAKGLLIQAIRDNDPVIFCEHKSLYTLEGDVPEEAYTIPFGEANVTREGDDVTIVTLGRMLQIAHEAADTLSKDGINCEVVDLRTTSPIDTDTIIESVENTGRLVVLDESNPRCSIATDVSATVSQEAFSSLKAPIKMVTAPHVPVPFAENLEDLYIPDANQLMEAIHSVMGKK